MHALPTRTHRFCMNTGNFFFCNMFCGLQTAMATYCTGALEMEINDEWSTGGESADSLDAPRPQDPLRSSIG